MKPFISLCMIVKNEEAVLARCLESVKGIIGDIIIVDTGSTDRTKEIAGDYTKKIFDFKWTKNFAEARNFAATKAEGKWILALDADEYVDRHNLTATIEQMRNKNENIDFFNVTVVHFIGQKGEETIRNTYPKIYKNTPEIKYHRAIREALMKEGNNFLVDDLQLRVFHTGYLSKTLDGKSKNERNLELLLKEVDETGENSLNLFYIGNEFASQQIYNKAIEYYYKSLNLKPEIFQPWVPISVVKLIDCLIETSRYKEALKLIHEYEKKWRKSPDLTFPKAYIYSKENRWDDAKFIIEKMLARSEEYKEILLSEDFLYVHPHSLLGLIFEKKKNMQQAFNHYALVQGITPDDWKNTNNLIRVMVNNAPVDHIVDYLESIGVLKKNMDYYRVFRLSLENSSFELAEVLIKRLPNESDIVNILNFSLYLYKGNIHEAKKCLDLFDNKDVMDLLKVGLINIHELIIISLNLKQPSFIYSNKDFEYYENFLKFIFDDNYNSADLNSIDLENYVTLLRYCLIYKQLELFEKLLTKRLLLKKEMNMVNQNVGHLLYSEGFEEIAIEFYQQVNNINDFDNLSFINLVSFYRKQEEIEDALELCNTARKINKVDFRLIKCEIEILIETHQVKKKNCLVKRALKYYPDSIWLKNLSTK